EGGGPVPAAHTRTGLERAIHEKGAADPVVDQVAIRKPDVGLEALDAGLAEPRPERWDIPREIDLHPEHRLTREGEQRSLTHAAVGRHPVESVAVAGADEEVRGEPVVHDERGLAGLQDGVEMHLRPAVGHAVGGSEYEPSGQARTSWPPSAGPAPASARRRPAPTDCSRPPGRPAPAPGRWPGDSG